MERGFRIEPSPFVFGRSSWELFAKPLYLVFYFVDGVLPLLNIKSHIDGGGKLPPPGNRILFLRKEAPTAAEAKAYAERFGQYGGQTLTLGKVSIRGGAQVVESKLNQTSGQPIRIEWEVKGGRITDVKIEGVSMVGTRRSDYKSYISNNGNRVDALINELESRAKSQ